MEQVKRKSELTIVDQEKFKRKSVLRKTLFLCIMQSVITFMANEPILLAALNSCVLDSWKLIKLNKERTNKFFFVWLPVRSLGCNSMPQLNFKWTRKRFLDHSLVMQVERQENCL